MHELSITENILDITLRYANEAEAARVTDLYLVIGDLSTVVDESVQFYWDFISEGTVAHGATLHFRRIPGELACQVCGHHYSPTDQLTCPLCDSEDVRIVAGEEFSLEAIDVVHAHEMAGNEVSPQ